MRKYRSIVAVLCGLLLILSYFAAVNDYPYNNPKVNGPFQSIGLPNTADLYLTTGNDKKNNPLKICGRTVLYQKIDAGIDYQDSDRYCKKTSQTIITDKVIDFFYNFYRISRNCAEDASLDRQFAIKIIN
ncbi:MAG: hypothetical protein GXY86_10785 [Firmicutes bacterium]|nr:hypothetical protein [Bacillota bacterium]